VNNYKQGVPTQICNKMEKRIKGGGELSRKLLTILVLAAMPILGYTADNSIYIDQSGDYTNVTINQDGAGNQVKGLTSAVANNSPTDPALIRGDGVNVNINQTGSNNKMNLGIDATMGTSKSVDLTYSTVSAGNISGSNNLATFQLGTSSARASDTIVSVTQLNGGNTAYVSMSGSDNQLSAIQSGGGATLISSVAAAGTRQDITTAGGTGNSVTTNLTGDNGNVYVKVMGATNTIDISQSGAGGSTGHQAWMDINGTGNSVTLAQSGSAQANVFNLRVGSAGTAANTNTYNITQTAR
jgi:hypothetical protein